MDDEPIIDESRLRAAEELVQSEEGPRRQLSGPVGLFVSAAAVAMSLLFLYWAWAAVTAQILRLVFLGFALVLSFLLYPGRRSNRLEPIPWSDWLLAGASLLAVGYALWDFEDFIYRAALPTTADQIFGALTILLVLEAARRTTGWVSSPQSLSSFSATLGWEPGCPRPGRTRDMDWIGSSATCTRLSKEYSACLWT